MKYILKKMSKCILRDTRIREIAQYLFETLVLSLQRNPKNILLPQDDVS